MKTPANQRTIKTITIVGMLVIVAIAVVMSVVDDRAGRPSLQIFAWLVNALSGVGAVLLLRPLTALDVVAGGVVLALAFAAVVTWQRISDGRTAALLTATTCAMAGQLFFLHRQVGGGVLLYGLAVAGILGFGRDELKEPEEDPQITLHESLQLLAVIALAAGFRFFALNQIPSYFEGELAPYMIGATSLKGMLIANAGWFGPWAPLGLLYYLPIYPMIAIAGTTVLAVRLASAAIGVLTLGAAYLLARELAGRYVALTTTVILALDPLQIGWSRSDVHPHGATTWPALLLAWATLRMIDTRKTMWFAAVAVLMAVTWHQYPSGQLAVGIPLIALVVHAATHREFIRATGWRIGLVVLGLVGWFAGYPLVHFLGSGRLEPIGDYLMHLGPRVAEVGVDLTISPVMHVLGNTGNLVTGVFFNIPHRHHQTFIPTVGPELSDTSLPWFVAMFAVVGGSILIARLPAAKTLIMLALTVTAAAPSAFSNIAYVKRAAVLYPVLEIIAAVGIVAVARALKSAFGKPGERAAIALLVGGAVAWTCIACHQWFSGRQYVRGTPHEVTITDTVRRQLVPDTIVIADFWHNYMAGKLTYLLLDDLQDPELQPVAWYVNNPNSDLWPRLERHPATAIRALGTRPWYLRWSGLDRRLDTILASRSWRRIIYLIQDDADENAIEDARTRGRLARITALCPNAVVQKLDLGDGPRHRMRVVVCDDHPGLRPKPSALRLTPLRSVNRKP